MMSTCGSGPASCFTKIKMNAALCARQPPKPTKQTCGTRKKTQLRRLLRRVRRRHFLLAWTISWGLCAGGGRALGLRSARRSRRPARGELMAVVLMAVVGVFPATAPMFAGGPLAWYASLLRSRRRARAAPPAGTSGRQAKATRKSPHSWRRCAARLGTKRAGPGPLHVCQTFFTPPPRARVVLFSTSHLHRGGGNNVS